MSDEPIEEKGHNLMMVDEGAMVRLVNSTIMPTLTELKMAFQGLKKDLDFFTEKEATRSSATLEKIANLHSRVTTLEMIINGGNTGNPEDIGMRGRISQINNWMNTRIWFERIIIAAVAVQIIGIIFLLAQSSLK